MKMLLQVNSNSLLIKQKQKQTTKQKIYMMIKFQNSTTRLSFLCCIMRHQSALTIVCFVGEIFLNESDCEAIVIAAWSLGQSL